VDIEFHQLELRFADLRVRDDAREQRLLGSLASAGQQVPAVVIAEGDHFVLIDGYARARALRRLRRDAIAATAWPVSEIDALIQRQHFAASGSSAFEEAWLLAHLRGTGLSLDDLARRLCRSKSWVSRRLALIGRLSDVVQARVRGGQVPPQAAMKYLVPLARANKRACDRLVTALGETRVSVRDIAQLVAGYRRADANGRERILAEPHLFLRATTTGPPAEDQAALLVRDLGALTQTAWRARQRIADGALATSAYSRAHLRAAWRSVDAAMAALRLTLEPEVIDAGPGDPHRDPAAA